MDLPKGFLPAFFAICRSRKVIRTHDCLVVMSPCHILTPLLKLIINVPIVLDAGWPLTDGILSRGIKSRNFLKAPVIAMVDFLSFHSANLVLVESHAQANRMQKNFRLRKSKIRVQFTGINENAFNDDTAQSSLIYSLQKRISILNNSLTVLFRGKVNRESGFENIIAAAKLMQDSATFIFVVGKNDVSKSYPPNVIAISGISNFEMKKIYQLSDISIGQVSSHTRLNYTIPHKAFEAGFFSIPYITSDSEGIREYLNDDSAVFLSHPCEISLKKAIESLVDSGIREEYSQKINERYSLIASQRTLSDQFDLFINDLCKIKVNKFF